LKTAVLLLLTSLLLAGCGAAGYLRVPEADLQRLDARIQEQDERLERLSQDQADTRVSQLTSYREMIDRLYAIGAKQEEMIQRQREWEDFIRSTRLQLSNLEDAGLEEQQDRLETVTGDKQVVGSVERVYLSPPGAELSARIDTGATTSSLDAQEIEFFERNGDPWVRFTVVNPEDESRIVLERKVVRNVRIIQAVVDEAERRPVVELGVTVGKTTQTAQFTLSDRRHLEHPVLIGRNVLMDIMVVDVSQSFIAPPRLPADLSVTNGTP
jgi:predicted small lipoprotein YifL